MPDYVTSLLKTLCSSLLLKFKPQLHRTAFMTQVLLNLAPPTSPGPSPLLAIYLERYLLRPCKSVSAKGSIPAGTNSISMALRLSHLKEWLPLQIPQSYFLEIPNRNSFSPQMN